MVILDPRGLAGLVNDGVPFWFSDFACDKGEDCIVIEVAFVS